MAYNVTARVRPRRVYRGSGLGCAACSADGLGFDPVTIGTTIFTGIKSLFGGNDAKVVAQGQQDAQQQLACALRGDVIAARVMVYGRDSSTRQGIRDAYAAAWAVLEAQRPDVAAAAQQAGGISLTDQVRNCEARTPSMPAGSSTAPATVPGATYTPGPTYIPAPGTSPAQPGVGPVQAGMFGATPSWMLPMLIAGGAVLAFTEMGGNKGGRAHR